MEICAARCCIGKQVPSVSWNSQMLEGESIHRLLYNVVGCNVKMSYPRFARCHLGSLRKNWMNKIVWRMYNMPVSLEQSSSRLSEDDFDSEENVSEDSSEKIIARPLSSDELKALLLDSEREKLIKKLSEANQQNRFLKRQLRVKEDAIVNFKSEIAVMELETQALVKLAEEICQSGSPESSRKINGKYIQSHLHSRLEALDEKLKEQIQDMDAVQSREVSLFWCGMAESVQVMGTFDGWSQGEQLSPAYDGSFTKFTTTLMLRPGRYEIKFLVDGEWQLSPEYPTVGEGLMKNNLLVVE